jgi:YHS domain-containing protein
MHAVTGSRFLRAIACAIGGALVAALPACRSAAEEAQLIHARPGHAVCTVCQCTGDLGCMDVEVGPETPQAQFEGRTYYFCSETCRAAFERNPRAYVGG